MAETLVTHGDVEAVKYSDDSHHLHVKNAEGKRGKQIASDEYLKQWGYDPNVRKSSEPKPIPVIEKPSDNKSAVHPAMAEVAASFRATTEEINHDADEAVARLDEVIPPNEKPKIPDDERKFQNEQKVKYVRTNEDGDQTEEGWEIVDTKGKNTYGEIIYVVKNPDGTESREISESLLENMQLAPEGEINSIENQFARLEERLNKRLEEGLARIEARLGGTEVPTAIKRPGSNDEAATEVIKPAGVSGPEEKELGPPQEFTLKGTDHNGQRYLIRGRTDGGPLQINRNVDKDWNAVGSENGWFDVSGSQLETVDLMNPPEPPEDKKLKSWTIRAEDDENEDELEVQEGDTAVIRLPDGNFNKNGKVKEIVEKDGKRFIIVTMPDGTEQEVSEEDYLRWHVEAGEVEEVPEEVETPSEPAAGEDETSGGELGPPQTGLKARWNQLRNWIKGKRGKARDAAVAAQVAAINKANGIKEPPDDGDETLTKEQKERKHKCRRLAFFIGGAALGAGGVILAMKYGWDPFSNSPDPDMVPNGPKSPPPVDNIPTPDQGGGGWHTESLEPYSPGGGSYNHYDAGTIWDHTIDDLQKQIDLKPNDAQIQRATQFVLDHNNLTWEQAKSLPVGFEFRVPNHFPEWVINGR